MPPSATPASIVPPSPQVVEEIHAFVREGIDLRSGRLAAASDPFWKGLRAIGTELWLDTGDLEAASQLWCAELSALTTNNTLLNAEVQKGIYDDLIRKAAKALAGVPAETRVIEIAFILNARHGLRLAQRFGGKVSVEQHTAVAHDIEATVAYGLRYHRICPEHFIVKVPLTAAGLIATRRLRKEGVPVNFTLGFSARHNYLAAGFAEPSYVNVFLGRLGAYLADNKLGDGKMVGEKATLASQRAVTELSRGRREPTRQIAASMRGASQVADLAGVDVYTMPLKVAEAARKELDGLWSSRLSVTYPVALASGVDAQAIRLETLWDITGPVRSLLEKLRSQPPANGDALVQAAHDAGAGDLFPRLDQADLDRIAKDGKIPRHDVWAERIKKGELAIDTLLNLAGLASFTADQQALDDRIRRLIG
jgi:transaldolase